MADATVYGALDVEIPAISKLRQLREEGSRTDQSLKRLGQTLDGLGGSRATNGLRSVRDALKELDRQATTTSESVSRSYGRMVDKIGSDSDRAAASIRMVRTELELLGASRSKAHVEISGTAEANAELTELEERLRRFSHERATATARINSSGGTSGPPRLPRAPGRPGGAGPPTRPPTTSQRRSFDQIPLGFTTVSPTTVGVLLPMIPQLSGALVALSGSLASAAIGFAEMGTAAGGVALAGLGSIAAVAVPAVSSIEAVIKAQDQLTTARQNTLAVQDSQRTNTNAVQQAEFGLVSAQNAATQAQLGLTQARRDAIRNLTDLQFAERSARLESQRSQLSLTQARFALVQAELNPLTTPTQLREATLGVQEARLQADQSRVGLHRSITDATRARRLGVGGNVQVRQAEFALTSARNGLQQARFGLETAVIQLRRGATGIAQAKQALDQAFARAPAGTRQLVADVQRLRSLFGAGLSFRGIAPAIAKAQSMFVGIANRAVRTISSIAGLIGRTAQIALRGVSRMGGVFNRFLKSREFARDMTALAKTFAQNAPGIATAMVNVARAFLNISVAIGPFLRLGTQWIDKVTRGWVVSTSNARSLQASFRGHLTDMRAWFAMLKAIWRLFGDLFRAGRGSGRTLLGSFTSTLQSWDKWVKDNPRKVQAFFSQAAQMTERIASALASIVKALWNLGRGLSPLIPLATGLVNAISPLLGTPFGALIGIRGLSAFRNRGRGGGAGGGGGGGILPFFGGGGGGSSGLPRLAGGAGGLGELYNIGRKGGMGRIGAAWNAMRGAGAAETAMGLGRGAAGLAGSGLAAAGRFLWPMLALQGGLSFLGKQGTLGERLQSVGHAFSFGVIPDALTNVDKRGQGDKYASEFLRRVQNDPNFHGFRDTGGVQGGVARINEEMARIARMGHLSGRANAGPIADLAIAGSSRSIRDIRQYNDLLRARNELLRQGRRLQDQQDVAGADRLSGGLQGVFNVFGGKKNPADALKKTTTDIIGHLRTMHLAGRRELTLQSVAWLDEFKKTHKGMSSEVEQARLDVVKSLRSMGNNVAAINGQILVGNQQIWAQVGQDLTNPVEVAREAQQKAFTAMQDQALRALVDMGYSRATAKQIITSQSILQQQAAGTRAPAGAAGGAANYSASGGHARGGRISGTGLYDTVPVAPGNRAAPGELIVNRHSERKVDRLLGLFGTSMGREVAGETTPHWASFATGGRVSNLSRYNRRYPMHLTGTAGASLPVNIIRAIAENAGFSPGRALQMAEIAHGESSYMPGIQQRDPGDGNVGYGLWQITPHAWGAGAAQRELQHLGGIGAMFNPILNAEMAKYLFDQAGHSLSPWYGTRYLNRGLDLAAVRSVWAGRHIRGGGHFGGGFHRIHPHLVRGRGVAGLIANAGLLGGAAGYNRRLGAAFRAFGSSAGGSSATGAVGPAGGPSGTSIFDGRPVAKWIIPELMYARRHGWTGHITSGYRTPAHSAALGFPGDEHTLTRYPGGAVDFGGMVDPAGLANRAAFLSATRGYHGRHLLSPIGFRDDGHMSGTGHEMGGRIPWFGSGGSMRVRRPMLMGVGDRQPSGWSEDVHVKRVQPNGSSSGGGAVVHVEVNMGGVTVGSEHDATELADKVAKRVAKELEAALERNA